VTPTAFRRRLAATLLRWAEWTLPAGRRRWANAMQNELPEIGDDWEAMGWAVGCLAAACGERMQAMRILDNVGVRVIVVLMIAFKVFDDLFATVLTAVYKLSALGAAERLGRMTPGDDYSRLVPLMDAVPLWLHGLWVLSAVLYVAAIVSFVLRRGPGWILALAGLGTEILATQLGRPIIAATGVVVNPNPSVLAAVIFPYVIPIALAVVLWLGGRARTPLAQQ
jgi:hypothetical protein